ncbi:MAG: DUF1697 domain-containing protein [Flavobacteriales bacterium]|jgi:uncharacterized protein (DUF1697 family)|nr:DUF1697 domain-containing protein [Flavobacteriales bacterium]
MAQTTFISLLRGINMMRHNRIKMPELKKIFTSLGHTDIVTYIQSGNIVFKSKTLDVDKISIEIVEKVNEVFGYAIKGLVISKEDLEIIFLSNPFLKREDIDISKLHVTLLNQCPTALNLEQIKDFNSHPDDEYIVVNKCIYLYCPNGYGRTKLTNNMFEKKLDTTATTRNWRTITKLSELS